MKLYEFGTPAKADIIIETGDQELRVSPRGFANEFYTAYIMPGCNAKAKEIAREFNDDVDKIVTIIRDREARDTAAYRRQYDTQVAAMGTPLTYDDNPYFRERYAALLENGLSEKDARSLAMQQADTDALFRQARLYFREMDAIVRGGPRSE